MKCHEGFLSLQSMFLPKRLDIFPLRQGDAKKAQVHSVFFFNLYTPVYR